MIRDDTLLRRARKRWPRWLPSGSVPTRSPPSPPPITAATEQELQQVVPARVAATFGGAGAMLALLDNETGLLHASSDARVDPQQIDAMEGLSLAEPQPLTCAIPNGTPQFIPNREELIRDWPQPAG